VVLQGGRVSAFSVQKLHNSTTVRVTYADVTSALGAFLLFYHCIVLNNRALLVDFEDASYDDSVSVPDEHILTVLVRKRRLR
jgi:hypothetical protein